MALDGEHYFAFKIRNTVYKNYGLTQKFSAGRNLAMRVGGVTRYMPIQSYSGTGTRYPLRVVSGGTTYRLMSANVSCTFTITYQYSISAFNVTYAFSCGNGGFTKSATVRVAILNSSKTELGGYNRTLSANTTSLSSSSKNLTISGGTAQYYIRVSVIAFGVTISTTSSAMSYRPTPIATTMDVNFQMSNNV